MRYIKTTYYELYFFSFIKILSIWRHMQLALLFSQECTSKTHLKPHKKINVLIQVENIVSAYVIYNTN